MTATTAPPTPTTSTGAVPGPRAGSPRRGRAAVVAVALAALLVAGVARQWTINQRLAAAGGAAARGGVATLNSFALGLLLGGMRGPLVMILWANSETAKQNRDLEALDTQIELIRLLQPEFDTVHIFQVWNKAYNISVQMASVSNKYTTILDALEYARQVNRERPNNVNMLYEMGSVYTRKLGDGLESGYYDARVRAETLPHTVELQTLDRGNPGWRPLQHEQMLDERGYILPRFRDPPPGRTPGTGDVRDMVNDGAELQYLRPYEPFRYGLSVHGLAYNYFRQAQALVRTGGQKHANLSNRVIDGRPRATLKMWAYAEWAAGRDSEFKGFGFGDPANPPEMQTKTAGLAADAAPSDAGLLARSVFCYALASRLARDAMEGHAIHEATYPDPMGAWQGQVDDTELVKLLALADHYYLCLNPALPADARGPLAAGLPRDQLIARATEHYQAAKRRSQYTMLRYYTPAQAVRAVTPDGNAGTAVLDIPHDQLDRAVALAMELTWGTQKQNDEWADTRLEYLSYIERADARLATLSSLAGSPATGAAR